MPDLMVNSESVKFVAYEDNRPFTATFSSYEDDLPDATVELTVGEGEVLMMLIGAIVVRQRGLE